MEQEILTLKERLECIVDQSYNILCQQIAKGRFTVNNEASFQLQFAVILKSVGQLYEFDQNDRFFVELEENINLKTKTCKSANKRARCDIWLSITSSYNRSAECSIELKCFRKSKWETTTDNRFSILKDIENLEHYHNQNNNLICYEIVYTNNSGYANEKSSSYLTIGNGCECSGVIISNNRTVTLQDKYIFTWDEYLNNKKKGHFFLKLKIG